MNVDKIGYNTTFKGFTNTFGTQGLFPDFSKTEYISMCLNDEGEKDLSEFQNIMRLNRGGKSLPYEKHLTFFHYNDVFGQDYMYVNDMGLYTGKELLDLEKDESVPKETYKKLENIQLKMYTLLASLTKRIMSDNNSVKNDEIHELMLLTYKTLCDTINNYSFAKELTMAGLHNVIPYQMVAKGMHDRLLNNMHDFFKVKVR